MFWHGIGPDWFGAPAADRLEAQDQQAPEVAAFSTPAAPAPAHAHVQEAAPAVMQVQQNLGWRASQLPPTAAAVRVASTPGSGGSAALGSMHPAAAAHAQNSLGVGMSGSGYLLLYLTGVSAVLKSLGVINSRTKLAGASGGAVQAAVTCAGADHARQYAAYSHLMAACRATHSCRGVLDTFVRAGVPVLLDDASAAACSGRLFVAVTQAQAGGQRDAALLLGPQWSSKAAMVDAAAASSYIPAISGASPVTRGLARYGIPAAYDGVFTDAMPSPPGATYTVMVSALAPATADTPAVPDFGPIMKGVVARLAAESHDAASAPFLPLDAQLVPQAPHAHIWPGLSGGLSMSAEAWNKHVLDVPDVGTMKAMYDQGRRDAAAWAGKAGLSSAAAVQAALLATTVA